MSNKIDFEMNTNPLGPPAKLVNFLKKNLKSMSNYPDFKYDMVDQAIADFFKLPKGNVAFSNGSLEAIYIVPKILDVSKSTIVAPTFWGYSAALQSNNQSYDELIINEEDGFELDVKKLSVSAKNSTIIFLCNPNNPTGSFTPKEQLLKVVKENPRCHFFIDEAHMLFRKDFPSQSLSADVNKLNNLSIVFSTSKLFNIAGLRTGIFLSNKEVVKKFKKNQIPYSGGSLSQLAMIETLKDKVFVRLTQTKLKSFSNKLSNDLAKIQWLKVFPSQTHFILCKITDPSIKARNLTTFLAKKGCMIRDLSDKEDLKGEWIRITSNLPSNNKTLLSAIANYKRGK